MHTVCPYCKEQGKKSRLYPSGGNSTLALSQSYYDEEGQWHNHDPNIHTSSWSCSEGHRWVEKTRFGCPAPNCPHKASLETTRLEDVDPTRGVPGLGGGLWVKGGS